MHVLLPCSFFVIPHHYFMCSKPGARGAQTVTKGLGQHFNSPKCPRDKVKTQTLCPVSLLDIKCCHLLARLDELESKPSESLELPENIPPNCILNDNIDINGDAPYFDPMDPDYVLSDNEDSSTHFILLEDRVDVLSDVPDNRKTSKQCILPDPPMQCLYTSWKRIILTLVTSYQHYTSRTLAKLLTTPPAPSMTLSLCNQATCSWKTSKLLCLFFDCKFSPSFPLFTWLTAWRLQNGWCCHLQMFHCPLGTHPFQTISHSAISALHGCFYWSTIVLSSPVQAVVQCNQCACISSSHTLFSARF